VKTCGIHLQQRWPTVRRRDDEDDLAFRLPRRAGPLEGSVSSPHRRTILGNTRAEIRRLHPPPLADTSIEDLFCRGVGVNKRALGTEDEHTRTNRFVDRPDRKSVV